MEKYVLSVFLYTNKFGARIFDVSVYEHECDALAAYNSTKGSEVYLEKYVDGRGLVSVYDGNEFVFA